MLGPTGPDDDVIRDGLKQFTADYGIRADILFGDDAEFFNKALDWYASGEQVDAIFVRENFLGSWAKDGLLQAVTAIPGLDVFLISWNELFLPLILSLTPSAMTLPVLISSFVTQRFLSYSLLKAAGVLAILPTLVRVVLLQKFVVRGLVVDALKDERMMPKR